MFEIKKQGEQPLLFLGGAELLAVGRFFGLLGFRFLGRFVGFLAFCFRGIGFRRIGLGRIRRNGSKRENRKDRGDQHRQKFVHGYSSFAKLLIYRDTFSIPLRITRGGHVG